MNGRREVVVGGQNDALLHLYGGINDPRVESCEARIGDPFGNQQRRVWSDGLLQMLWTFSELEDTGTLQGTHLGDSSCVNLVQCSQRAFNRGIRV